MSYKSSLFATMAKHTAHAAGHPVTFCSAVLIILVWAICGPIFGFSDTWQLIINTGTTIVTFLMVFLVQNTQNRDSAALQLKVDELIRAVEGAHDSLIELEELTDEELQEVRKKYQRLAARARKAMQDGNADTNISEDEAEAGEEVASEELHDREKKKRTRKKT